MRMRILLTWFLCMAAGHTAFAQEGPLQAGGFNLHRAYFSQLPEEHIDTASGNVLLTFTDLELPGDAGSVLRLQRTYNSNRAEWRFGPQGFAEAAFFGTEPQGYPDGPWVRTVDGAIHSARWRAPGCPAAYADPCGFYLTKEFWRLDVAAHTVSYPDVTVDHFVQAAGGTPLDWLESRTDPFGNWVSFTRNPQTQTLTITQSVGGSARTVVYQFDSGGVIRSMAYDSRTWVFDYDPLFGKLAAVTPPVGPGWRFEYAAAPAGTYWGTPVLSAMTTPNRGRIQYDYVAYDTGEACPSVPPIPGCTVSVAVVTHRQASGPRMQTGDWVYQYPNGLLGNEAVIIGPDQHRTELTYTNEGSAFDNYGNPAEANLARRVVRAAGGTVLEDDVRHYANVTITSATRAGILATAQGSAVLSSRTIERDGVPFTTTMAYRAYQAGGDYHQPQTVTEIGPAGTLVTNSTYEVHGRPTDQTVGAPGGTASTFHWDYDQATGFVTSETRLGIRHDFTKDVRGNRQTDKNANNHVTTYGYAWGAVASVSSPSVTTVREIRPDGLVHAETTAGRRTEFDYDAIGRTTLIVPPGPVNPILIEYDNGSGSAITSRRGSAGSVYSAETVDLDGLGRVVARVNAVGDRTTTTYDPAGRATFAGVPTQGSVSAGTSMRYDALGRLVERTQMSGATAVATSSIAYTGPSRVVTDENGHQTTQTWKAYGDPDAAMLTDLTDAKNVHWSYTYDSLRQLVRVSTTDGIERTWSYISATDRLQSESHPESGVVSFTYDAAGNAKTKADQRPLTQTYVYDTDERLSAIEGGDRPLTLTYEAGSNLATGGAAPGSQTIVGYDGAGRVAARSEQIEGTALTALFDYDANDRLRQITYPTGRHIRYFYDDAGRVTQVADADSGAVFGGSFAYTPWGAIQGFTAGNGVVHQFDYDPVRLWPTRVKAGPFEALYELQDGVGNVRRIRESPGYSNQNFTYAELDRLTGGDGPSWVFTYAYDRHGNRQTAGGTTYTYEPGTLRLQTQGSRSFTYDAVGNTIGDSGATFSYNADNLMSSATLPGGTTSYLYNCEGKRVRKTGANTVLYTYGKDGELLSEWTYVSGAPVSAKDYVYAAGRLLAVVTRTAH